MFCEKCGVQLPDGTAFCTQCGADLRAAEAPAPTAAPAVDPTPAPAVAVEPTPAPAPTAPPVQSYVQQPAYVPQQPAYMPPVAPPPAAYKPAPTTAGTGFRVVNCILAPFALTLAILHVVLSLKNTFDYFEYSGGVLSGIMNLVMLVITLVCAIMLLAAATKREYRRGGTVAPLLVYVISQFMYTIVNIIRFGGDALRYYFSDGDGLEQTIQLFLLLLSVVFFFVLIGSARSPRPALWPLWLVLVGLVVSLVLEVVFFVQMMDYIGYYIEDSLNSVFTSVYYILFFLIYIFMAIRTALLGKRGVPVGGRPPVAQPYVANYVPPTYQGPYGG